MKNLIAAFADPIAAVTGLSRVIIKKSILYKNHSFEDPKYMNLLTSMYLLKATVLDIDFAFPGNIAYKAVADIIESYINTYS